MMKKLYFPHLRSQAGFTMAVILAVTLFLSALAVSMATIAMSNIRFTSHEQKSATALNVAEAGVNYYLWHLSHNTTDYCDGAATCTGSGPFGPYTHDYFDTSGKKIGTFSITITPPSSGSTTTTVQSVGQVSGLQGTRTILAKLGIPSFASYIFLIQNEINFSATATTTGPVHSNTGIKFDGTNNGPVTSARATYVSGTDGNTHNGVWGAGGPTAQWQFPVPAIDFAGVTANLSNLKSLAQSNGVYVAPQGAFNVNRGYYLNPKSNGTIDIFRVTNQSSSGITTTFVRNQTPPTNGILYVEDNVWVSGTSFPGRLTIVSARLPDSASTRTSITITNNLTYNDRSGSAVIGLIAQEDITVPVYAPSTLTIEAALLGQKGAIGWWGGSPTSLKTQMEIYGSMASTSSGGFKTVSNGNVTNGYTTTLYNFDSHLTFNPPPSFPITGTYSILNWRELLYNP